MPGPSNGKRIRKSQGRSQKKKPIANTALSQPTDASSYKTSDFSTSLPSPITPIFDNIDNNLPADNHEKPTLNDASEYKQIAYAQYPEPGDDYSHALFQKPYIYDPGNGPRVRDTRAVTSRYFSQPPAFDDPLCAEFAQEEVLQMLSTVLPDELALILWYNKSRATSRICPACQRLYHVGDVLPDHSTMTGDSLEKPVRSPPELEREQELSGICSSLCFILASFNQCDPRTTKAAWGHTANEMDDASWEVLNGASYLLASEGQDAVKALVMIVRMTRLEDLGLAQLCFPDVNWEEGTR
ncbi:hypothetical protein BDP27DRAFT_1211948 [Rhodocollybia butyracea]|uniref:Uncharacterized protein n=1 Tax=Rhodocollybia butyracea TaxID=206335 RepID=A0A9P5UE23_9AGAR|nr:hypothetical protein BDP27DRAFT_1211948 [Rhodocollybia butyracea]